MKKKRMSTNPASLKITPKIFIVCPMPKANIVSRFMNFWKKSRKVSLIFINFYAHF